MKKAAVLLFSLIMLVSLIGCPEEKEEEEEIKSIDPALVGGYYDEMRRTLVPQQSILYFYEIIMTSSAKCYRFTETTITIGIYANNSITQALTKNAYCKNGNIYSSDDTLLFSYEAIPESFFDPEWNAANTANHTYAKNAMTTVRQRAQAGGVFRFTTPEGVSTLFIKRS